MKYVLSSKSELIISVRSGWRKDWKERLNPTSYINIYSSEKYFIISINHYPHNGRYLGQKYHWFSGKEIVEDYSEQLDIEPQAHDFMINLIFNCCYKVNGSPKLVAKKIAKHLSIAHKRASEELQNKSYPKIGGFFPEEDPSFNYKLGLSIIREMTEKEFKNAILFSESFKEHQKWNF